MSTLSIGVSGLNAANIGLSTASHNIANASTPGYNRQVIVQGTNIAVMSGAGFIGQGTNVQTVKRVYDGFLAQQVLSAQTGASEMDSYLQQIQQIDNLLADTSSGLSPVLAAFFAGVQEVAANPSSIPARQSMLSAGQSLVARFQGLDQRLSEIRDGVNTQISGEVSLINSYATQIADLNERILLARAGTRNQEPNDLLDQRDQLLADLNQSIKVSALVQSDGSVNVFFGNGQPLVVGEQAYAFTAKASSTDPERIVVAMEVSPGNSIELPESQIVGGKLGGLVAFRSQSLDEAQNSLGRIAIALALDFNDQHQLGMDLTGAVGGEFFDVAEPTVRPNSLNTGTGNIEVSFGATASADLTSSDYQLSFDGSQYTLVRLADGTARTYATLPQTVDGMTIDVGGWTPTANDSFVIQPTRAGASGLGVAVVDARNIAAAAPMRSSAAIGNTGTAAISQGSVNAPPPPDVNLAQTVTITFNNPPTTFNVAGTGTGNPTNVVFTAGANISYNGWTIQIVGSPAVGDTFAVSANANGVSDNRNATALAGLQTAVSMLGGTASYQSAYSQIVSAVGNKTREVQATGAAQQSLADAAEAERQKVSGVNLDEEAANLLRYQQAYQAAARVIEISNKLFDDLLAVMR